MKVIYKYELKLTEKQTIEMPAFARFLSVQVQNGKIQVWALVDTEQPPRLNIFKIIGTGGRIDETLGIFLGTIQLGGFVWHVFLESDVKL